MTVSLCELVKSKLKRRGSFLSFTASEVQRHCTPDSAWIGVDGLVDDITDHVQNHPGWECGCAVSELLAILRVLGE